MELDGTLTEDFAKLLNEFYLAIDVKKHETAEDYNQKLTKKFKLDNKFDHYIIEASRYLLEDTEFAINNFIEFGLDGPTKYRNIDERYLRLYGILNAVNLQKSVPIELIEVFKIGDKKKTKQIFAQLKIIDFRNKVGAHTLDYKDKGRDYFRLAQSTLKGMGHNILIVGKDNTERINIIQELDEFKRVLHLELYKMFGEIFDKFFDPKSKKLASLKYILSLIDHKQKGGMLIKGGDGRYIKVSHH